MTNEMTTLKQAVATAVREAEEHAGQLETLETAVETMKAALKSLEAQVRETKMAGMSKRAAVRIHEGRLHVAEANAEAQRLMDDRGGCPRERLMRCVSHALQTTVYGLAEAVVRQLEFQQRYGGFRRTDLEDVGVNVERPDGRHVYRKLTDAQQQRVWHALRDVCPTLRGGVLGTPHVQPMPAMPKSRA